MKKGQRHAIILFDIPIAHNRFDTSDQFKQVKVPLQISKRFGDKRDLNYSNYRM